MGDVSEAVTPEQLGAAMDAREAFVEAVIGEVTQQPWRLIRNCRLLNRSRRLLKASDRALRQARLAAPVAAEPET